MTTIKTILFAFLSIVLYVGLGHYVPLLGATLLVVMPACWLGGLVGYAALGALTYKGIIALFAFGALAQKV